MSFDFQRIWDSKAAYRRTLAARPIAEKLRLLDELRARALLLQAAGKAHREKAAAAKKSGAERGT